MDASELALLEYVDRHRNEIVDFVLQMIRIPSENPPADYGAISRFLEGTFQAWGFDTEVIGKPGKPNVLARLPGTARSPVLILNPHIDTVPAGSGWSVPPFEGVVRDGRIIGRGAYDCRGRIAIYAYAMKALHDLAIPVQGDALLACSVDEETGGQDGPRYLLENGHLKGDIAIVEGQDTSLRSAHKGILWFRVTTHGRSEHGGREWLGVNAIEMMTLVLNTLAQIKVEYRQRGSAWPGPFNRFTSLNVGTIEGGVKTNAVPDRCTITVDCRVEPDTTTASVEEHISTALRSLAEEKEFELEVETLLFEEPQILDTDFPLFHIIQDVIRERRGAPLPVEAFFGLTDCRFYHQQGIPALNFGGPGGSETGVGGHKADEFIRIDELIEAAQNMALILYRALNLEILA